MRSARCSLVLRREGCIGHTLRIDACQLRLIEFSELFTVGRISHQFDQSLPGFPLEPLVDGIIEFQRGIRLGTSLPNSTEERIGMAPPRRQFLTRQGHPTDRCASVLKRNPAISDSLGFRHGCSRYFCRAHDAISVRHHVVLADEDALRPGIERILGDLTVECRWYLSVILD